MKIKMLKFGVHGRSRFPLDMLRYDQCWPAGPEDVARIQQLIEKPSTEPVLIKMNGLGCTLGRWESFGFIVTNVESIR